MFNFLIIIESDVMMVNILMMGLIKVYFKYIGKFVCGLLLVMLFGEFLDW